MFKGDKFNSWTQHDFYQLYPEPPPIQTTLVYFTIKLQYKNKLLNVRVPKAIQKKNLSFLLHKAIFYYLLEIKEVNPLLKTAEVIGFMTADENIQMDYQLWKGEGILTQKIYLKCLYLSKEEGLEKYIVFDQIQNNEKSSDFLVRSQFDGAFYTMKRYDRKKIQQDRGVGYFQQLKDKYRSLYHPFVSRLYEAFITRDYAYFVFDYIPTNFFEIRANNFSKLEQNQLYFYCSQMIYGLFYLYQQNVLCGELNSKMIGIGGDGHILLHYDFYASTQVEDGNLKNRYLYFKYIKSLMISFLFETDSMENSEDSIIVNKEFDQFIQYLEEANPMETDCWKKVLSHQWMKKISSQKILSKTMQLPRNFAHFPSFQGLNRIKLTDDQNYDKKFSYSSLGYRNTEVNLIIQKYGKINQELRKLRYIKLKSGVKKDGEHKWQSMNEKLKYDTSCIDELGQSFMVINKMKSTYSPSVLTEFKKGKRRK